MSFMRCDQIEVHTLIVADYIIMVLEYNVFQTVILGAGHFFFQWKINYWNCHRLIISKIEF